VERKARLFFYFPEQAVLRAFALFKLAANAYPFVLVFVYAFLYPVEHQVLAVLLYVA